MAPLPQGLAESNRHNVDVSSMDDRATATDAKQQAEVRSLRGAMAGDGSSLQEAIFGFLSGAIFGLVSPIIGHPFDCVKTKMQAESQYASSTFFQTVSKVYQTEGIRGFYRGFFPPLIGSMLYRGLLFSAYSGTYAACEHVPILHEPIPFTGGLRPSVVIGAMSAAVARATIESPLDFIKVRNQIGKGALQELNTNKNKAGTKLPFSSPSPYETIRHLYHGYTATLFRTMGLLGSFFILVDYSVRYIPEVINAPLVGPLFKGGICATTAWVVAFPFETTKSIIQADHTGKYKKMSNSTFSVMGQIYKEKGVGGLYRGFGPGAGRSFIANGTSMVVYAWFQDFVRKGN